MPFRQVTLALFSLALLVGPSAAQTAPTNQSCLIGGQGGIGLAQVATDCPIGRAPALSSFRLAFSNGDHRFRQATLMPNGESFEAALADSNGDDPWYIEARWHRVPEAQGGVVTAVVQGMADIPIPRGPANTTLVLSGFEFKRVDGADANIRTLAIATDTAGSRIRTVLLDDQGNDYTTLATAIGVGFAFGATGVPDPNMSVVAANTTQSLLTMGAQTLTPGVPSYVSIPAEVAPPAPAAGTGGGPIIAVLPTARVRGLPAAAPLRAEVLDNRARPYRVRVAYLWVPNARLANTRMVSGNGRTRADTSGTLPRGMHVLHGFSFHFGNSDHFLGGVGIHLRGGFPKRDVVERRDHLVTWEDANLDDPIQWTARFSDLVGGR